jgi:hypothetical protein
MAKPCPHLTAGAGTIDITGAGEKEGELSAIAFRGGGEIGRSALRSSRRALGLHLGADRTTLAADGHDAAFLTVEIADADRTVEQLADDEVELRIGGTGHAGGPRLGGARDRGGPSATPATPPTEAMHRP